MALKIGIIGFGGMAHWHATNASKIDGVEYVAAFDVDEKALESAEKEFGMKACHSAEELLAIPEINLVLIATPNQFHKPYAIAAMRAGKNVLSEKPATLSVADWDEMVAVSKETGKLLTVHQNRRWDGEFLVMRDLYRSGELGDMFAMESRVQGSHGIPGDWRKEKAHGGGMMLDWGVHLIDQMVNIVTDRKLLSVYCRCDHLTNAEVDDGFKMDMYYEGDLCCRIEVGTSNFINLPRFYACGMDGSALIQDWGAPCHVVSCHQKHDTDVIPVRTAAGLTKTMAPRNPSTITEHDIPQPQADVHDFYRNVVRAIDGLEEQIVTHDQMRFVMKIMEAAMESDRLGRPVEICN